MEGPERCHGSTVCSTRASHVRPAAVRAQYDLMLASATVGVAMHTILAEE